MNNMKEIDRLKTEYRIALARSNSVKYILDLCDDLFFVAQSIIATDPVSSQLYNSLMQQIIYYHSIVKNIFGMTVEEVYK